jgi:hypothetical protein
VRRSVPRRRRARGRADGLGAPHDSPSAESRWSAEVGDFDPMEFAEFLEADDAPLDADPAFRERLRQELWTMVRDRAEQTRGPTAGRPRAPGLDPKLRR